MSKMSDNQSPKLTMLESAAPSTPASGLGFIYEKTDGNLYFKNDGGTESQLSGGAGGIAATIFDAKGDLIAASAADTAARLAVGANNAVLMAASGESTGLKWFSHTTVDAPASGNTTIVNANTFYDGPNTGSLAAGTWLCVWQVALGIIVTTSQSNDFSARLWDGTTTYSESAMLTPSGNLNGETFYLGGVALAVLGSPATLKISAANIRGSSASQISRNISVNSASSNLATRIVAMQLI